MEVAAKKELSTGRLMPVLGLGTWEIKGNVEDVVESALEIGYRMIDTSSDYGSQAGVGRGIAASGIDKREIYVVTKVEETDNSYTRTLSNLKELGLDYIDLMLIHRPPENGAGEDLWEDLIRAQKDGLVLDIGVSNYSEAQITALYTATGQMPVVNQIEWSPFGWSQRMLDFCMDNDIVIQAYSPLTRAERLNDEVLHEIAEKYHKSPVQVLIRWNLQMGTIPITKSETRAHMEENSQVFDFELQENDLARLCGLNENYSALGDEPVYMEHRHGGQETTEQEFNPLHHHIKQERLGIKDVLTDD